MTPDDFRRRGHELVDWVADYLERLEELPVVPPIEPGWVRAQLPEHPPAQPEPWDAIVADLDRVIVPGMTHWQSPNFYAYFQGNSSGPAVLGELVCAALGNQGMLWQSGPASTELESHVLDWLAELLGLPEAFRSSSTGGGVILDGASTANLCAILAARDRVGSATALTRLRAYTSDQAHSSVEKGARIAGLAPEQVRHVPSDADFALVPTELARVMADDVAAGHRPFFVCATVGTTSSHAMDPLPATGQLTREHRAWFHVDAAHAGVAAIVPELRGIQDGVELADSYCTDPHKWLFTGMDCDAFWVADRAALTRALSVVPEYLRNPMSESGAVIDYRDWQIVLGRRFRALKLWFVLRHYGAEGLRHHLREHVAWAQQLAARIDKHPRLERAAPTPLNLVCFRHVDGDDATQLLLDTLNAEGQRFLTHTRLAGRLVIRASIGTTTTRHRHIDALWDAIEAFEGF